MSRIHTVLGLAAALGTFLIFLQLQHYVVPHSLRHRSSDDWPSLSGFFSDWWDQAQGHSQTPVQLDSASLTPQSRINNDSTYRIGVGRADITGPVVEINFMGYADPKQTGSGLRQRLYARSFIVCEANGSMECVIYIVLDTQSGDLAVRDGVLEGLKAMGSEYQKYNRNTLALTGTHSHSGPGAWLNYLLPQITSKGFNKQSYEAIVEGTLLSIRRAHESLAEGDLRLGSAPISNANINRSPYAYLANPKSERDLYEDDVDKDMSFVIFRRHRDRRDIGMLNWFPVHGTSMLGNNTLVTGDNKGVAARLLEKSLSKHVNHQIDFVAGFSQSNVGDTTPNVLGAWCEDGSGEPCSFEASLCGGRNEKCHGRGPFFGLDDSGTRSCYEIGRRQFQGALDAYLVDDTTLLSGPVRGLHVYRDFGNKTFSHPNGTIVTTCSAALGYGFAAGTSDGPGAFDFKQNSSGDPNANPLWSVVRNGLHTPSEEQKKCQYPKPILLDVGATKAPYQWAPNIVDVQTFRIGQLFVVVSPGEATTMAGRRWKAALLEAVKKSNMTGSLSPAHAVLGGPANSYTHYIATEEEYAVQRYEGASTLYGPHTLNAYIDETMTMIPYLEVGPFDETRMDTGPLPPVNTNRSLSFITPVVRDGSGLFHSFGDVLHDVLTPMEHVYRAGDVVKTTFVGANPRNNLKSEASFAQVVRLNEDGDFVETVRDDGDWDLVFEWKRTSTIQATSEVTISWELGRDAPAGIFRLIYNGDHKSLGGKIEAFAGQSGAFEVGG